MMDHIIEVFIGSASSSPDWTSVDLQHVCANVYVILELILTRI